MVGIYQIKNLINGKIYIGQSVFIEKRWVAHRSAYQNPDCSQYEYPIYRAIRKYGIENFSFCVLEECSKESLDEKEQFYIEKFASLVPNGYNQKLSNEKGSVISQVLTKSQVDEIKILLMTTSMTQTDISKKYGVSQVAISDINLGHSWLQQDLIYPLQKSKAKKYYCLDCGKEISKKANYCVECAHKHQRHVERPSRDELKKLIREESFLSIGKKYNVTDNAIRKWCDSYGLPRKKSEIKSFSEEEWANL